MESRGVFHCPRGRVVGSIRPLISRRAWLPRYWLPALVWAGFIFWGSTDALSGAHTSRLLRPLLHWLAPGLDEMGVDRVQLAVRKAGHLTEYAILTALLWRALNGPNLGRRRPWPQLRAWLTWALAVAYAASDEFHQTFVATREGSLRDVGFDAAGALAALGLIWWWGLRRRWV